MFLYNLLVDFSYAPGNKQLQFLALFVKTSKIVCFFNLDFFYRGGYSKPTILDVLWLQIILLPYTVIKYVVWYIRWMFKFVVFKEEYGEEEKLYLIRKNLQCSIVQWDAIPEDEKKECFEQELWIKDNFKVSLRVIYIHVH